MDETYIKVGGRWVYLYRAVDKAGRTVDFFLSRNRDVNAAKTFLRGADKATGAHRRRSHWTPMRHRNARCVEMKETGELSKRVRVDPANT